MERIWRELWDRDRVEWNRDVQQNGIGTCGMEWGGWYGTRTWLVWNRDIWRYRIGSIGRMNRDLGNNGLGTWEIMD